MGFIADENSPSRQKPCTHTSNDDRLAPFRSVAALQPAVLPEFAALVVDVPPAVPERGGRGRGGHRRSPDFTESDQHAGLHADARERRASR